MDCSELLRRYEDVLRNVEQLPEGPSEDKEHLRSEFESIAAEAAVRTHWLCAFLSNVAENAANEL
jgi:hypothetical protein